MIREMLKLVDSQPFLGSPKLTRFFNLTLFLYFYKNNAGRSSDLPPLFIGGLFDFLEAPVAAQFAARFRDSLGLGEDAEEIAAEDFVDVLFAVAAAEHFIGH